MSADAGCFGEADSDLRSRIPGSSEPAPPGSPKRPNPGASAGARPGSPEGALPRLHLITDDRILSLPEFPTMVRAVIEAAGGGIALHLRGPTTSGRTLHRLAVVVEEGVRTAPATRLFINDRVDLALLVAADGVHLPAAGLPPAEARRILGAEPTLGLSTHAADEILRLDPPDRRAIEYLLVGTLFPSRSHPGRGGAGVGLLREVAAVAGGLPLIGIGGITPARVAEATLEGAAGVAVLGGVWDAPDPARAVREYLAALPEPPAPPPALARAPKGQPR